MTSTTANTTPGQKLKDTISPDSAITGLIDKVQADLDEELQKAGIELPELLNGIARSFAGINPPAFHSGDENSAQEILQAIIVHFASDANLKALPEAIRPETLNTLHYLHTTMERIGKHDNILFSLVNLYDLKKWHTMSEDRKEEIITWYK